VSKMRCDLKTMMRSTPECDRESCVYWNDTHADPAFPLSSCTLIQFGLIGKHPDKLARWLYHYMLLYTRNKAMAMVAKAESLA